MDELDKRMSALIELGRDAHDPTSEDEARVRAALAATIGAGGAAGDPAATPAGPPGGASSAPAGTTAVKWWVMLALVGAGVGLFAVRSRPEPAREPHGALPTAPVAAMRAPAAAPSAPRSARPQDPVADALEPATARTPHAAADPVAAAPARRSGVARPDAAARPRQAQHEAAGPSELSLIRDATRALRDGRAGDALSLLLEHERRFPGGVLAEERSGLHVLALCALGRSEQGRKERAQFLERAPTSPLAGRVKAACWPEGGE